MGDERSANAIDKRLGRRVRELRVKLGISQAELAAALGVSCQQVQKYETGANRIAAGRLLMLAGALDLRVADFFEGLEDGLKPERLRAR